jgi:hypothetical protein
MILWKPESNSYAAANSKPSRRQVCSQRNTHKKIILHQHYGLMYSPENMDAAHKFLIMARFRKGIVSNIRHKT